jgi:hypothetical protein
MVFRAWEGGECGRPPSRWGNTCGRSCAVGLGAGGCPGGRLWGEPGGGQDTVETALRLLEREGLLVGQGPKR